jgi:N6-L-threonylcarbamoyladenine synthase
VAARSHIEAILPVIDKSIQSLSSILYPLSSTSDPWSDIDAIAVSTCPGLIGSLMIGVQTAKTLALLKNKPLYPVHHVEAHVYANFLNKEPPQFPILALIVSGGHSQIVLFRDHGDYQILGATRDDAVGEAFDKVAKVLGLPYPGGPSIAKAAEKGDPYRYKLPKPILKPQPVIASEAKQSSSNKPGSLRLKPRDDVAQDTFYEFSFSGLKTAVLRAVQAECGKDYTFPSNALSGLLNDAQRQDFAASFQNTAVEILVEAVRRAQAEFQPKNVVIAGGVAANQELRRQLSAALPVEITYAPPELCTDNAAMVASLGYFKSQKTAPTDPRQVEITPSIPMLETGW